MVGGADKRDARSWVVLELTRAGEARVEEGVLADLLREALGVGDEYPVFIPSVTYTSGGRRYSIHLMEGYAFVASGLPETSYFNLEGCPYVRSVLTTRNPSGMLVLSVIPDASVQDMRKKLAQQVSSDLEEGMRVVIVDGVYTSLEGEVLELDGEDAHVRITLRSLDLVTRIPRVFLAPPKESDS